MSQSQGDPKHVQIALTQQLGIVAAVVRRIKVLIDASSASIARRIPAVLTDTVLTLSRLWRRYNLALLDHLAGFRAWSVAIPDGLDSARATEPSR